ncbi:MAG TPA: DUF4118 domain-containing protein, partial [Myxococcaceae bacterium]|nr:DUF4118 domain-containing protein [Myxococcaceae bacterium]
MSHSLTFSRFLDAAPQWNRGARYVLGLASTVLALALSGALVEPLGGVCFAIPLAVIALLSLLAGQGPGLVASGAIVVGIWFFLLEPRYSLAIYHQVDTFRLVIVFISSALISIVAGSQHKARARLVMKRAAARKAAREAELASEEARRSNEALRASEQRFRQLADSMPQIVWASSPDGTLDYYNRKWYELTGAEPGTSGDTSWLPILHPD